MNKLLAGLALLALTGCAQYSAFTSGVASAGADAADRQLETALFVVCKGITVGAWVRRFGNNEEAANAWRTMCVETAVTTPVITQ